MANSIAISKLWAETFTSHYKSLTFLWSPSPGPPHQESLHPYILQVETLYGTGYGVYSAGTKDISLSLILPLENMMLLSRNRVPKDIH